MKTIQNYIVAGVISFMISVPGFTQDLNSDRMNRDIRIMENVLNEMFKTSRPGSPSGAVTLRSGAGNVNGTYLPGYGVIFTYEAGNSFFIRTRNSTENEEEETVTNVFSYSTTDASGNSEVDKESIKQRMKDFLKDYAPTIGQLKDDENVLVIYKSNSNRERFFGTFVVNGQSSGNEGGEGIPTISVAAKKADLNAVKEGKLNENAFNGRLEVSESDSDEVLDLKIFSNILETGLSESGNESFRSRGNVSYLLLDNFGALFNLDARYDMRVNTIEIRDDRVREVLARSGVQGFRYESSEEAEKSREERMEKIKGALDGMITDLKQYLVDYGTTLSSVKSTQNVMITVNLGQSFSGSEGLPNRVSLQINKSDLDQLNQGSLSRDQAMDRVSVMEY